MSVTRGLLTSGSPFPSGKTSAAGIVPLDFPFIGFHRRRHTAGHPQCPARRHPVFRSSPGGLRRRASVGRQSVSCFHTQPVGDTHGSLFTPTFPPLRAAVPVLRPVPRLPPACFYNAIFPFITKIVRLGRFTFYCFHQCWRTTGHPRSPARRHPTFRSSPGGLRRRASVDRQSVSCFHTQPVGDTHGSLFTPTSPTLRAAVPVLRPVPRLPPACFYNAIFPFITKIVRLGRFTFLLFSSMLAHRRTPAKPGTPIPYVPFQSGRPPAQGERGPAECVMFPHTACR